MHFSFFLSFSGLAVFLWRLQVFKKAPQLASASASATRPLVSVVLPARNEESNIETILQSLTKLIDINYEIIVVDDNSTDQTAALAQAFTTARVMSAGPKPRGWSGKSWACWQGAKEAKGDFFLFTDADTVHTPTSLARALDYQVTHGFDLMTAPPYHRALPLFEKTLGLFHLIPLIAAAFRSRPTEKRFYSTGQYLLVRKEAYFECGGHEAVRDDLIEDFAMALLYLKRKKKFGVYPTTELYLVQMYPTATGFLKGWKRLLRLGIGYTNLASLIETVLILNLFTPLDFDIWKGCALIALVIAQRKHGAFSFWGALLAPVNCLLFIALSLAGFAEATFGSKVTWRDRSY